MNTLKMIVTGFLILVIAILTGCSDSITSSGETGSSEKGEGVIVSESLQNGLPVVPTFRTQIKLKPYKTYTFDEINSGFDRYYSIDITNLSYNYNDDQVISECENILVYSEVDGQKLSCHSNGFEVRSITLQNTGSKMLDLEVSIRGIKQKKEIKTK